MSKETKFYLDDAVREDVDKRREELAKEFGFRVSLTGYINHLINEDLKKHKPTKSKNEMETY